MPDESCALLIIIELSIRIVYLLIACHLGRDVKFDPKTGSFGEDREANALLTKEYRAPYSLPKI